MPAWSEAILEGIRAFAPVATALIALSALRNWKRQDKSKREAEFLDALIEAAHTYIAEMNKPVALVEMARIGMASQALTEDGRPTVEGTIAYIKKDGARDSKRLRDALVDALPSAIRLKSLVAKGQVFKFSKYGQCRNAINMLTWQFDRIEAFMSIIESPFLNWEHPEVLKQLREIMEIKEEDIRRSIKENNERLLEFGGDTYKSIYG